MDVPEELSQQSPSFADRLTARTRSIEEQIQRQPFFAALAEARLSRDSYIELLRALAVVHAELEHSVARAIRAGSPLLASFWQERWMRRSPLLEADLAHLDQATPGNATPEALLCAYALTDEMRRRARQAPYILAGYVYALVALGPRCWIPAPDQVARILHAPEPLPLSHLADNHLAKARAKRLLTSLESALLQEVSPQMEEQVIAAACAGLSGMRRILQAVSAPAAHGPVHSAAMALNPEAGDHAVPEDPREVMAALRAGERTWNRFPYYEWRYGERGRSFTRSDSAWLVTLASLTPERRQKQVLWLSEVLSQRGMPRWLLEVHLEHLHEELCRAVPERAYQYSGLLDAAHSLRDLRFAHIDGAQCETLSRQFDDAVGAEWAAKLPETGALIAAAVADERSGVRYAVVSLVGWLTHPARFSPVWIDAVRSTLRAARDLPSAE